MKTIKVKLEPPVPFKKYDLVKLIGIPAPNDPLRESWGWSGQLSEYVYEGTLIEVVEVRHDDQWGWLIDTNIGWTLPPAWLIRA